MADALLCDGRKPFGSFAWPADEMRSPAWVLPKEISDQIVDRTDGVPLFIEELTKTWWRAALSPKQVAITRWRG